MQKKTTIFVIIVVAIFFAFFVYQNKKASRVAEIAPAQETSEVAETAPQNADATASTEELATVPANIPTDANVETPKAEVAPAAEPTTTQQ